MGWFTKKAKPAAPSAPEPEEPVMVDPVEPVMVDPVEVKMTVASEKLSTMKVAESTECDVEDPLDCANTMCFDEATMSKYVSAECLERFKSDVASGAATISSDQVEITEGMYKWAREKGATDYSHWFFPMRGSGGGATGGMLSALKADAFIDLDWKSKTPNKPFYSCFPKDRLFGGESDGSSFPNGGLRVTHAAAAFTTWDRGSPCFVSDKTLRIPCCFVTHTGKCIDEKTPLLRSQDAVQREAIRMLGNCKELLKVETEVIHTYLGWEQEFFVVGAEAYKKRPDLVNCGRTLFGKLPHRNQQGDLNYFAPVPNSVEELMVKIQAECLRVGMAMSVRHNEVAPAQHEMCPIYCVANTSCDQNVYFMEIATREAEKLGLAVLFHEKPFAGINGSGKHANWSVGTGEGVNFFHTGKTAETRALFTTTVACLAWGLLEYNELVRNSVASAGNDHRLGAQEAPPAIISLFPGTTLEAHIDSIIESGDVALADYDTSKGFSAPGCRSAMPVECAAEDRNRTAPFPHCGNRFEFRAVGSTQNCSFPLTVVNTLFAAGLSKLSDLIEGGSSHSAAVASILKEARPVIFTGNGYSAEWPVEAAKRGLPNLINAPQAMATMASEKNIAVLEKFGVYTPEETKARAEVLYENYNVTLKIEAMTMVDMVKTSFIPAFATDLATYAAAPELAGDRASIYAAAAAECTKLDALLAEIPHDHVAEADYFAYTVKPQMDAVRVLIDSAESVLEATLYPFPTYHELCYGHHF